jgi:D-psicose/D-tagatose/L-ribulose 3-epimerase
LFARLKETGFDGVEVPLAEASDAHYRKIRKELDSAGLACTSVVLVHADSNPISPDASVRRAAVERLKWAIDRTALLGGEVVCGPFHSAYKVFTGRGPSEDEKRWGADVLREAGVAAAKAKITMAVEFLNRFECYFLNTTADTCDHLRRVDHPSVELLYDTHHANIEERDVAAAIATAGRTIGHVHVSESHRGTLGEGQVRWPETFRALKKIGYDRWLVIEAFSRLQPDFAAAVHIWRDCFTSPEQLYRDGHRFVRARWSDSTRLDPTM